LYDKIMSIDPQIRFATIANKDGKIEHTGHREGVTNVLTSDESKKSLQRAIDSWNARNDLSDKIGVIALINKKHEPVIVRIPNLLFIL